MRPPSAERDGPRDECGVFGICAPGHDVARLTHFALCALQHRGEEAAGIATTDPDGQLRVQRGLGLVAEVFDDARLDALTGASAIGHVRYSTTGASTLANAQPVRRGGLAIAHNGNLVDTAGLRRELLQGGATLETTSDSELIAALLAGHDSDRIDAAVLDALARLRGAYSVVALTDRALVAFRDPAGVRPLSLGLLGDHYCVASETSALDAIGARTLRDVSPGEVLTITPGGIASRQLPTVPRRALCVFEHIYFARADSELDGEVLQLARERMGERLWREAPVEADLVVGVPDSGMAAAHGLARAAGLPRGEGMVRNRYATRTFIQPGAELRARQLRLKLSALPAVVSGKRVVLVDDSIVRGTTMGRILALLRDAGASEVHVRIAAPAIRHPCRYGIDMSTREELIASGRTEHEVASELGCDSLHYLSLGGLYEAIGSPRDSHCDGCFSGDYPFARSAAGFTPELAPGDHADDHDRDDRDGPAGRAHRGILAPVRAS